MQDDRISAAALAYCALGVPIVLLGDAGTNKGKQPRFKAWADTASSDEEIVGGWFEKFPKSNIGILLGPASGFIDVEFDSEEGRKTADRILTNSITPTYRSARSVHRLYRWSGDMPAIQKFAYAGLEIRLGGGDKSTQSVLPPSLHPSGTRYEWLEGLSIYEVEASEIPEEIAVAIANREYLLEATGATTPQSSKSSEDWATLKAGVSEGGRNEALASLVGRWLVGLTDEELADRDKVEQCFLSAVGLNQRNKPPMPESEVKTVFGSILSRERQRRADNAFHAVVKPHTSSEVESYGGSKPSDSSGSQKPVGANGSAAPPEPPKNGKPGPRELAGFKLTIIQSDPPVFYLHSPLFQRCGGSIRLTASQIQGFVSMRTAALEQAFIVVPKQLSKKWDSILEQLIITAEHLEADPELHRPAIIAATILELVATDTERPEREIAESGVGGYHGVQLIDGGKIAVNVRKFRAYLKADSVIDSPTQAEVIEVLRRSGGKSTRRKFRYWVVPIEGLDKIDVARQVVNEIESRFALGGSV